MAKIAVVMRWVVVVVVLNIKKYGSQLRRIWRGVVRGAF